MCLERFLDICELEVNRRMMLKQKKLNLVYIIKNEEQLWKYEEDLVN